MTVSYLCKGYLRGGHLATAGVADFCLDDDALAGDVARAVQHEGGRDGAGRTTQAAQRLSVLSR